MANAQETPVKDLLRGIPADARLIYDHGPFESHSIPVGALARRAADRIHELEVAIEAWRSERATGAVQAGAVPDGYKLVPIEATPEMIAAAVFNVLPDPTAEDFEIAREAAKVVLADPRCPPGATIEGIAAPMATIIPAHRAMLAACPSPAPVAVAGQGETSQGLREGEPLDWDDVARMLRKYHRQCVAIGRGDSYWYELILKAEAKVRALAASPAPHEGAKPVAHYLVVTGEVHEGQETYTVHDKPVPLADNWKLYAAPQEHEARDAARWQPIETAPKDGTEILVSWPMRRLDDDGMQTDEITRRSSIVTSWAVGSSGWGEPAFLDASGGYYDDDDEFSPDPDLWQPLPAAPDAARAVKGDRT